MEQVAQVLSSLPWSHFIQNPEQLRLWLRDVSLTYLEKHRSLAYKYLWLLIEEHQFDIVQAVLAHMQVVSQEFSQELELYASLEKAYMEDDARRSLPYAQELLLSCSLLEDDFVSARIYLCLAPMMCVILS